MEARSAGFEDSFVNINGIRLHVVQAGPTDGSLVILLHGFPEFWYAWHKQIPALAKAGYRVWAPDQRGYNLSDKPKGLDAYTLDQLAADVIGLIDASGRAKVFLVGHDWGAGVTWWTALKYPQRLEKIVVLNVPHPAVMNRRLRTNFTQLCKSWYIFFFQIPWLPEALVRANHWRGGLQALRASGRPDTFSDADLERYREAWSQPGAYMAMLNWYRALVQRRPDLQLPSVRITVPTLLIWGMHDVALSQEMAPSSIDLCDNGRLVLIEEATHWVQHDEPAQVNQLLLEFLGQ
jgi:pimeloyl-ACP methyl ester carboxylesterase